jgi:uncharacterized protein (TIGR03067 family)
MTPLFLGLAVCVGAPALKGPATPSVEGDWELVEWVTGGSPVGVSPGTGVEFRPDGKRLWRDGNGPPDERGYKLHAKTNPPAIDLIRPSENAPPDVFPCIYKVDAGKLLLCIGTPGGPRPTDFEAGPGTGRMLMTFKRLKKD